MVKASGLPIKPAANHDRLSYKLEQDGVKIISGGARYAAHYARCALSFKSHWTPYLITKKYAVTLRVCLEQRSLINFVNTLCMGH